MTFRKQLLPRFCRPGKKNKFSGRSSLSVNNFKELKFSSLPSFMAKRKPATPSKPATDKWNPELETNLRWDKARYPFLRLRIRNFTLVSPSILILLQWTNSTWFLDADGSEVGNYGRMSPFSRLSFTYRATQDWFRPNEAQQIRSGSAEPGCYFIEFTFSF